MKWSILICTLKSRKDSFNKLESKLLNQIEKARLENEVEIRYFLDNREYSVGHKRNELIADSNGEYTCFIDDDDDIHDDYINMIYKGLLTNPDCVSLTGIITRKGKNPKKFIHSIEYNSYFEKHGIYYRPPNHLNPIKRTITEQFKFPELSHGEDTDWALRICRAGALKKEYRIDIPYYFYLFNPATSETLKYMKRHPRRKSR